MWEGSRSLTLLGTSLRTHQLKEREEKKQVRKILPSNAGQTGGKNQKQNKQQTNGPELICICIGHLGNTDKTLFIFQENSGTISSNIRA